MTDKSVKARVKAASPRHKEMRLAVLKEMKKYNNLPAIELLCVLSQVVGALIALQDQTKYNSELVMMHVSENIRIGNMEALKQIMGEPAGHA